MQHYAVEDWVQLAEGQAGPALEREMREHLRTGCPRCSERYQRWDGRRDGRRPRARDRAAERAPTLGRRPPRTESAILSGLLYDATSQRPASGLRADGESSRHHLYEAGSFILDVHVEVDVARGRVSLAGQILHRPDPLDGVSELPVFLVEGNGETLAETRTNDAGEFVLEFEAERRLRVALVINGKRAIILPSTATSRRP